MKSLSPRSGRPRTEGGHTPCSPRYSHGSRASGELDMECLDSGMVLFRENCTPGEALESSYRQAFGKDFDRNDVIQLMSS